MALGPLTADQENAIWATTWRVPGMTAQPLTGWLLHSMGIWADKRTLSDRLLKILRSPPRLGRLGFHAGLRSASRSAMAWLLTPGKAMLS